MKFSHSGAFALGTGTAYAMLPDDGLGIVVLTNGEPVGAAEAVVLSFLDDVELGAESRDWLALLGPSFAAMLDNPSELAGKKPPAHPAAAGPAAVYVGTYGNDYYGPATVTTDAGGALVLHLGPEPMDFPLTHWDGDEFSYLPRGENATGIAAVTFAVGSGTHATSMRVENLDANGLGTFTSS